MLTLWWSDWLAGMKEFRGLVEGGIPSSMWICLRDKLRSAPWPWGHLVGTTVTSGHCLCSSDMRAIQVDHWTHGVDVYYKEKRPKFWGVWLEMYLKPVEHLSYVITGKMVCDMVWRMLVGMGSSACVVGARSCMFIRLFACSPVTCPNSSHSKNPAQSLEKWLQKPGCKFSEKFPAAHIVSILDDLEMRTDWNLPLLVELVKPPYSQVLHIDNRIINKDIWLHCG